jgi:uncharacterized protein YndB with AHSA1/START domain
MAAGSNLAMEPEDRVLIITRIFDAPRELVWKAWTEPERMVKWHGPRGFTSTIERSDFRPGGAFRIHMRGPENDEHWTQGVFREIVAPERLVMASCWADAQGRPVGPETTVTVTLENLGARTQLTLHQGLFESVTARDAHNGGWNSALDCLAEYLATA